MALSCLLLWKVFFPYQLSKRANHLKAGEEIIAMKGLGMQVTFDSDEYDNDSSSESKGDSDEYEEKVAPKSKKASGKASGRSRAVAKAKAATNGKSKGSKKRKREESDGEQDDSDGAESEELMPAKKQRGKASSDAALRNDDVAKESLPQRTVQAEAGKQPAAQKSKQPAVDNDDSSDDDMPLAQRPVKLAA
jgi:hypothetical protein